MRIRHIVLFVFCLILFRGMLACGGEGVSQTSNPETTITISKLTAGTSTITIPLSVFGADSSALTGATIDVYVNGLLDMEDLAADDHYSGEDDAVVFDITDLVDGDVVEIRITLPDGTRLVFRGAVSETEDSDIALLASDDSLLGRQALADHDLGSAVSDYCVPVDDGSTSSTLAFGCFLSKLISLPETTDAQTLLAAVGESPINVGTLILDGVFGGTGYVDSAHPAPSGFDEFQYSDYPALPLHNIFDFHSVSPVPGEGQDWMADIINRLITSGTTIEELKSEVVALRDDFEYMESMLDTVMADSSFSYSIPKELFSTETDLVVSPNDIYLFMGTIKMTIVGLNIIEAYTPGVNFEQIHALDDGEGNSFDYDILLADLNGTGETIHGTTVDTVPFVVLDDALLITSSKDRADDGLFDLYQGLSVLARGEMSDLLTPSLEDVTLDDLGEVRDLAGQLWSSLQFDLSDPIQAISFISLTIVSNHSSDHVGVNLANFFANPPDPAAVTSSDPFVYEDEQVKPVEIYFRDLLRNIVTF